MDSEKEKLIIRELTVGVVGTCCYIVGLEDRDDCVIIDPGDEAARIRKAAEDRRIAAILLTHGHFDHIGGIEALREEGTRIFIHPLDSEMLQDPALNASERLLRRQILAPEASDFVREGDELHLAGMTIQVLHTPGHTPGGVCYRIGDELFTGDTLFVHGWGRTDLAGGNQHDMMTSLRRLIPLSRTMRIHPGHED